MRNRANLVEILRACVNGDDARVAACARTGAPLDGLADLAREHRVVGSVYRYLEQLRALSGDERRQLTVSFLQNRVAHQRIASDVQYLAQLLAPLSVPWLIVKGPAAAATLYSPPELRAAGDIDALIDPEHFAAAVELLERAGHPVDDANWPLVREMTAGQLHMTLPSGTLLDLHWHLLYEAVERRRYPVTTAELIDRRRLVTIADTELFTLDPSDTLIHLCFHAANEGADCLGWLTDITRAAAVPALDWEAVVTRTIAWRMPLPVGTVLQRARQQLGAQVPVEVTNRLLSLPWRTMMTAVDRAFPVAATRREVGSPASLLAKSSTIAGTPVKAFGAAASGIARRILRLAQTGDTVRVDPSVQHDTPASLQFRAEFDAGDREAYFAAIGAEQARSIES